MTRIPLPAVTAQPQDAAAAIRWFPAAGLLVGACVAAGCWLGLQRDPWAGGLLGVLAWVAITGALHLDGLGDIADAAGASHANSDSISRVLADPHIGSFGVTAITLQLLAKLVLLRLACEGSLSLILAIPAIARIGPMIWTLTLPRLHHGMGSTFGAGATWAVASIWGLILCCAAYLLTPYLLIALPAAALWAWWLRRRIGGISGDGHGAGIELLETVLLATVVFTQWT